MTKYTYKHVDISTLEGLLRAERLQALGWTIVEHGFNVTTFCKAITK